MFVVVVVVIVILALLSPLLSCPGNGKACRGPLRGPSGARGKER